MVLTVEPGIYVDTNNRDVPPEYRGIGIRIEDDILITPEGQLSFVAPPDFQTPVDANGDNT